MHILAVGRSMMDQDGLLMFVFFILGPLGAILGSSGGNVWAILALVLASLGHFVAQVGSRMAP